MRKGEHEGLIDVVIETPAGSRIKYGWDPKAKRFRASRLLPLGMAFPFDFGFVPDTKSGDGNPIDVLVLADAPLPVGIVVACKILGVVMIEQSEEGNGRLVRNDRVIGVPEHSIQGASWRELSEIGSVLLEAIESFFQTYVEREGRSFHLLGHGGAKVGRDAIAAAR